MGYFRVNDGIVRNWFAARGNSGNLNEMIMQHMISYDGYAEGYGVRDYIYRRLTAISSDLTGSGTLSLQQSLDNFFSEITGLGNVNDDYVRAQEEFFLSASTAFDAADTGNDSYTVLLLHGDGTDAATTFTDSSAYAHTLTGVQNAQIDTDQSVFGGASIYLPQSPIGDYLTTADSADWNFGAGDFTIDLRFRITALTDYGFCGQRASGASQWTFLLDGTPALRIYGAGSGTIDLSVAWTPSVNTWYHVAVTRSGSSLRFFVNGTQQGTTQTISSNMPNVAAPLLIGRNDPGAWSKDLKGWIDEFRISQGIARWTANFTPPTVAYS